MNFLITNDKNYQNDFDLNEINHKDYKIFFDNNWTINDHSISKGLSNNHCTIQFGDTIEIEHNEIRDFPLWYDSNTVSNFTKLENYVPVDGILKYDGKWHLSYQTDYYNDPKSCGCGRSTTDRCIGWHSYDEEPYAVALIKKVLLDNTKQFVNNNNLDIFVPNNNGLDTLTVRSVLDYLKVDYKLFDIKKKNYVQLQKKLEVDFYGFNQIQEFDSPTCVVTGFYGDEYILRNPSYIQPILKNRNVDLVTVFDAKQDCYMKDFFDLAYKEKCSALGPLDITKIKQMICNDVQVWHINNTMLFTPFRDKRLLKLLECSSSVLVNQVTDGKLSKIVIEHFNSDLLKLLDKSKNQNDPDWFWQKSRTSG